MCATLASQLSDTPVPTYAEDAKVTENDIQLSKENLPLPDTDNKM